MDRQEVITILEALANGIDPGTGARIPHEAFHTADAVRALFTATSLLKAVDAAPARRNGRAATTKLTSAGAPWTKEEDAQVCSEFEAGLTAAQIGLRHGRTSGAIKSRLVKLGRLDPATLKARGPGSHAAA